MLNFFKNQKLMVVDLHTQKNIYSVVTVQRLSDRTKYCIFVFLNPLFVWNKMFKTKQNVTYAYTDIAHTCNVKPNSSWYTLKSKISVHMHKDAYNGVDICQIIKQVVKPVQSMLLYSAETQLLLEDNIPTHNKL